MKRFSDSRGRAFAFWLAGFGLLAAGCASLPGTGQVETPAGKMEVARSGAGTPTIIFEAGAGDGREVWEKVFPETAKLSTAFAYSRRGHGLTPPVLGTRTGEEVVRELHDLLAAEHLPPPYVLVGHSIGGLYMELFAKLHPDEVAGLVLVDPTHPDHLARMRAERPGNYRIVQTVTVLNSAKTLGAELRGIEETGRQWHAAPAMPRRPIIVLSATRSQALDGADFATFTQSLQTELVKTWPDAEQRRIDSTHYIQREKPDAVVAAIKDVLARLRSAQSVPTIVR